MRLIDADALPFMSDNKYDGRKIPINRIRKWIENAPTVEAIPIEWLIEYAEVNEYETDDEQVTIKIGQIMDLIIEDFKEALTYSEGAE